MGRPELETSTNIKMVGLMIRLTRVLWSTRKAVIMDSGLCVLKGPLGMRKRLINGSALVIMRLYCTKGVHGEVINN